MFEPVITSPNSFPALEAQGSGGPGLCGHIIETLQTAHVRIHHALSLADVLSGCSATSSTSAAAGEIRDFIEGSFLRHMQDEEVTLAPRLTGRHVVVDQALATMASDHFQLKASLARLAGLCGVISRDPMRLNDYRFQLDQVVHELKRQLEPHQELEEAIVFPAVRRLLDAEEISHVYGEMLQRRRPIASA